MARATSQAAPDSKGANRAEAVSGAAAAAGSALRTQPLWQPCVARSHQEL